MKSIFEKFLFISNLKKLNDNFKKCENIVNKFNLNYNVNRIDNYSVKMLKSSVECNAFDVNEDKQRQCYKQLKCFWPKCRYSTKQLCNFNNHISHHLNKRQFVCNECNKQFHQNSNLNRHKRLCHSNVRPFVCYESNCQKSFKSKGLLQRHLITHSNEKSFKCDECKRRFGLKEILLQHKQIHSKQMPFKCDVIGCEKRFKLKVYLCNHKIRIHSGIKRYKCFHNYCDKCFVNPFELKSHIAFKHSTDRPYKCIIENCNSTFKCMGNLKRHNKFVHNNNTH